MEKITNQLNNTIRYNLFGEPKKDVLIENLETAAVAYQKLKSNDLTVENEDIVISILKSDNPFDTDFLLPYNL